VRANSALLLGLGLVLFSCGGSEPASPDAPAAFTYTGTPGQPVQANFGGDLLADVAVTLNGQQAGLFTVDTGAAVTILNNDVFTSKPTGRSNDDIGAFNLHFPGFPDVAFPIASGGFGLIGGDLLRHFAFTLDYEGDRAILFDPFDPAKLPGDVQVQPAMDVGFALRGGSGGRVSRPAGCNTTACNIVFAPTRVILTAVVENQTTPITIMIDSGASVSVMSPDLFNTLVDIPGQTRPRLDGLSLGGVTNASIQAFLSRVYRLTLTGASGNAAAENIEIAVIPNDELLPSLSSEVGTNVQMLVGGSFLRYFLVTVDYPKNVIHFAQYTAPKRISPDEFVGVGFALTFNSTSKQWSVAECYPNHDAFNQGIQVGDIVLDVDGTPITGASGATLDMLFGKFPNVGDKVPIVTNRSNGTLMIAVENLLPDYFPPP